MQCILPVSREVLLYCLLRLEALDQGRVADYGLGLQPLVFYAQQVKEALILLIVELGLQDVMGGIDSFDPVGQEDSIPAQFSTYVSIKLRLPLSTRSNCSPLSDRWFV